MTDAALKDLLLKLHDALARAEKVDPELLGLVRDLDSDIQRVLNVEPSPAATASIVERATVLESQFAARHPVAEQVIREIVDTLGKIGV